MKVIFTGVGGTDSDKEMAKKSGLQVDHEYTVIGGDVYGWSASVKLDGLEGSFNTTMFDKSLKDYFAFDPNLLTNHCRS